MRFRAASLGEAGLLGCIERLRDEIMEDFPPEVLLQRPGAVGHLAALLRWGDIYCIHTYSTPSFPFLVCISAFVCSSLVGFVGCGGAIVVVAGVFCASVWFVYGGGWCCGWWGMVCLSNSAPLS